MQDYSQFPAVSTLTLTLVLVLCLNDKSFQMSSFIETMPSYFFVLLF